MKTLRKTSLSMLAITTLLINPMLHASKGYLANCGTSVSIFDTSNNIITGDVSDPNSTFNCPSWITFTPDQTKAYVTNGNSPFNVSIIDVATDTVIGTVDDTACPFNSPFTVALTPDGKKAYVDNLGNATVSVIDVATDTVTKCVDDSSFSFGNVDYLAISPDGTKAYVTSGVTTVAIIDVTQDKTIGYVTDGGQFGQTQDIEFSPDGKFAYIADGGNSHVWIVDVASDNVIGSVTGSFSNLLTLAMSKDGSRLYVADGTTIKVVDTATNTVIATTTFTTAVQNDDITINPEGTLLYIPKDNSPFSVQLMNLSTNANVGNMSDPGSRMNGPIYVAFVQPSAVTVCKKKNVFLTQTECFNSITWQQTLDTPLKYNIYRDAAWTDLAGTTNANTNTFIDHNVKCNKTMTYYVVAVYPTTNVLIGVANNAQRCSSACGNTCGTCDDSCSNSCMKSCTASCSQSR